MVFIFGRGIVGLFIILGYFIIKLIIAFVRAITFMFTHKKRVEPSEETT